MNVTFNDVEKFRYTDNGRKTFIIKGSNNVRELLLNLRKGWDKNPPIGSFLTVPLDRDRFKIVCRGLGVQDADNVKEVKIEEDGIVIKLIIK